MQVKDLADELSMIIQRNPDKTVIDCYNYMVSRLNSDDAKTAVDHYQILIQTGDAIKDAPPDIQEDILEDEEYER